MANGGRWCHTGGDGRWCVVGSYGCGVGGLVGGCMLFRLSMKRLAVGEGDGRWPVLDGGAWGSACDAKVRQLSARTKFGRAAACYFLLKSEGLRVNSS